MLIQTTTDESFKLRSRGTMLKNKQCSTRSDAWNKKENGAGERMLITKLRGSVYDPTLYDFEVRFQIDFHFLVTSIFCIDEMFLLTFYMKIQSCAFTFTF